MGRDLCLYTERADKSELISLITSFDNVKRTEHLWDWPKGSEHFHWFDNVDYRSTTGVELTVFPVSNLDRQYDCGGWALHARNTYSATWHDVSMLNTFLRKARKNYGGNIIGDYGKNRYAPLWPDTSTPMTRGYAWVYEKSERNISAVSFHLPKELDIADEADDKIRKLISANDPARVIFNGLVPFLVSVVEFYLKNIFIISLQYETSLEHRINQDPIRSGQDKSEFIIGVAERINFQDPRNVRRAFKKWLDIDIRLLTKESEPGFDHSIWNDLMTLIDYRHNIIHGMGVDASFSREEFLTKSRLAEDLLEALLKLLSEKHSLDFQYILDST